MKAPAAALALVPVLPLISSGSRRLDKQARAATTFDMIPSDADAAAIDAARASRHNSAGLWGENGMAWEFITKPVRSVNAVSWEWEWRFRPEEGAKTASARTFASFRECVADARLHGFTGDPEPGESGTLFHRPESRFVWY